MILLTAYASVETAVEAMKLGAFHFANKPFNLDEVVATVERALETTRLRREVRQDPDECCATLQPAEHRRRVSIDGCPASARRQNCHEPGFHGAAHGRERHRQRSPGESHPLLQQPSITAVHEHYLLSAAGTAARERTFRP